MASAPRDPPETAETAEPVEPSAPAERPAPPAPAPSDPDRRGRDEDEDEPGWVSALVAAAGALGANKTRLRWKLRRFVRRRREAGNRVAQKVVHVRYAHRVCGHCTAVNDRGDATCSRCGRPLASRPIEMARRLGLWVPRGTPTTLLGASLLVVFVAMVVGQTGGSAFELAPWTQVLHGANLPGGSEPLRDLTSLLVHGGVFHVLLGVFTVASAGGLVERELCGALVSPVFLVTGFAGAAASDLLGRDGLGLGAAAGVCGLIGAGAIIGQRAGTRRGITYRNELLSVGVLVVGFGVFVDTDYRAVLPAAALGALLGRFLPRAAIAARPWVTRTIGVLGAAALIALTVLAAGRLVASPAASDQATAGAYLDPREPGDDDR